MSTKAADIKMVKAVSQKSGETATPALPEGVGTFALWLILVLAMAGFMHLGFNDVGNTRGLKVYGVTIPDFGSLNIPGLDKVLAQGNQTKPEPKPPVVAPAPPLALDAGPYSLATNVLSRSGLSAAQLDKGIPSAWMKGLGGPALAAEVSTGINALFILAHARIEVGDVLSQIATDKHNIFGYRAFDSCAYQCAVTYPDFIASLNDYAGRLRTNYLTPGGQWYSGGTTIHHIFVHYSSSHDEEGRSIAIFMNQIRARALA